MTNRDKRGGVPGKKGFVLLYFIFTVFPDFFTFPVNNQPISISVNRCKLASVRADGTDMPLSNSDKEPWLICIFAAKATPFNPIDFLYACNRLLTNFLNFPVVLAFMSYRRF